MIDTNWRRKVWLKLLTSVMAAILMIGLIGCSSSRSATTPVPPSVIKSAPEKPPGNIAEVSPPAPVQQLRPVLDNYQPQVKILSPQPDEVLEDNTVAVQFQVEDLPIFKNALLGLGPHLQVILDNQPYQAVYDRTQPLVLEDLPPGTHTLRVFASRPWYESYKNEQAYAQTTFHIFTKTDQNNPNPGLPLLTYNHPQGSYGAEPIMLDFYLTNAPNLVAQENPAIDGVRIRCTINGESFTLDQWQPIYLKGFKPGKNWVQLELIDEQGNPIKNVFNNTIRVISYNPEGKDTLSQLVRGELSAADARGIVDPNYVAKEPTPTPTEEVTPTPTPTSETRIPAATPTPTTETPTPVATPTSETPIPAATPTSETPAAVPIPALTPTPVAVPSPAVEETPPPQQPQDQLPKVKPTKPSLTQPTASKQIEEKPTGGYFNRFRRPGGGDTTFSEPPTSQTPISQPEAVEKPRFGGFFNRFRRSPIVEPTPSPSLPPTLPEIIVTPTPAPAAPKAVVPLPETLPEVKPSISPQPSLEPTTPVEEKPATEETSETNSPVNTEETTKPIEPTPAESEVKVPSDLVEPSAPEPSETPAPGKTTGVVTES